MSQSGSNNDQVWSAVASARRWRDIFGYAMVGAAIWIAVVSFWPRLLWQLVQLPALALLACQVPLFVLIAAEGHGRWLAFAGLKFPWRYPPTWLAGVLGTAVLLLVLSLQMVPFQEADQQHGHEVASLVVVLVSAIVLVVAGLLARERERRGRARRWGELDQHVAPLHDYAGIVEWVRTDEPIREPREDRFGLSRVAFRAAERLVARSGSQLVVGALGCGKTSLRQLVRWNLHRSPGGSRTHVVEVELWQYETARAAVAGVIETLVFELRSQVNVVSVAGVRPQYLAAMNASGGVGSVLAAALHGKKDPFDALDAIDEVAGAVGLHLVVWVEDLERFLDGGVSAFGQTSEGYTLREAELLTPIRALVHGLDRLEHVSVVTATIGLLGRFDLEKIARFIEEIPPLDDEQVWRLVSTFRTGIRGEYPGDIDPIAAVDERLGRGGRHELDRLGDEGAFRIRADFGNPIGVAEALVGLLDTPRKLKLALRLAHEQWTGLHGEVDCDDLIAMTGLRVGSPRGFALVRDHLGELQRWSWPSDQRGKPRFSQELDSFGLSFERMAIGAIAKEVFERSSGGRPQGLHVGRYWERYIGEHVPAGEERDQRVLGAIQREDVSTLVELLATGRGAAVENLDEVMPNELAWRLLAPLCDRLVDVDPSTWASEGLFGGDAPGVVRLWRIWTGKLRMTASDEKIRVLTEIVEVLEAAIASSVRNLGLLRDLEYYFVSSHREARGMLLEADSTQGPEFESRIRVSMWRAMVACFAERPQALVVALRQARPYTFWRLVWGSARCEAKEFTGIPFEGWPPIQASLVAAAKVEPMSVLPELSVLVVRETGERLVDHAMVTVFEFEPKLCALLFGSVDAVLDLPWEVLPEQTRTHGCVDAVREYIKTRPRVRPVAQKPGRDLDIDGPAEDGEE